ncbi:hypothetical protein BH09ACT10_BH09ACT10_29190 [soil metagenome]
MARTAVIAGTAQAVSGNVAQKQQAKAQATAQQQAPAPQYEAPPAAPADDMLTQLARLGQMNQAGLITDEEFSATKAKLLGI